MNNIQVIYNGIQEDVSLQPAFYVFTDKNTRSTFLIKLSEQSLFSTIEKKVLELKQAFDEAKQDKL